MDGGVFGVSRKDAYYFSHDSNAKDDPKCAMLIEQLGLEGYGIFWVLVEVLRDQPDYTYPLKLVSIIARKYNTTGEKIKAVICGYDLFQINDNDFFSLSLNRRMQFLEEKREKSRIAGMCSGEARRRKADSKNVLLNSENEYKGEQILNGCSTDVQQMFNRCSTDVEQVKERKENERKENERKKKGKELLENAIDSAFKEYIVMREEIQKPLSEKELNSLYKKLCEIAEDEELRVKIVQQSTENKWLGFFQLKAKENCIIKAYGKNERLYDTAALRERLIANGRGGMSKVLT